ncbi:caspase-8-like isoform X2 [Phymastichus coffea]|uniref:caspase-8-like isoform X2 n=1 Tax=Phymastichus coffea TaxID=108790 RepID=UPI00273CBD71|nr:caspase-8-like isoform X2 [Phymastichus coffea]
MTDVVPDAKCTEISNAVKNIAMRVTPAILKEMLNDLDKSELISLVFLMVDRNTDFYKVLEEVKEDPRIAFEKLPSMNAWAEKLIESLMILGNKYVIRRMGFDNNEIQFLENLFVTRQHNVSPYLNKAIKSLYFLCANLDNNEAKRLINEVNKNLGKSSHVNPNDIYLELFILEWLQEEYISVNPDEYNLSNLLKCVKNIGCLFDLSFNFDYWEISDMVLSRDKEDSQICSQTPDINCSSQYHQNINCNTSNIDADIMWSSPDHLKLFIIINQMDFTDTQKFKSRRKGSMEDEINLEKTFKSCNFQIEKYRNLKKQSMMKLLESLNSKLYSKYGAIFICVLSHGFKGEVVCADDNCISIDAIKEKFCCQKLQNVFKFLILQSCQGEKIGLVERQYGLCSNKRSNAR